MLVYWIELLSKVTKCGHCISYIMYDGSCMFGKGNKEIFVVFL